jgi:pimeloyl-ACP methyl ester carboxylesterase
MYYHGWPSSRLQARLADGWARERGIRLIALDRPGMGQSTFVPDRRLGDWPALMEDFANRLGVGKFGQLGVSGGGPYVAACAAAIPHRLSGNAVLAGAAPLGGRVSRAGLHWIYRALIPVRNFPHALFSPPLGLAAIATRAGPDRPPMSWILRTLPAEDREILLADREVWPVIAASFREGVRQGGRGVMADAEVYFQDPGFDPAAIAAPIRYWHGGEDRNIPLEMVENFVAEIPGAKLQVVKAAGHFSLVLGKAKDALDYLAECAASGG